MDVTAPHLEPEAQIKLTWSDNDRIRDIRTGYWINHPVVKNISQRLDVLYDHPKMERMPCLFIESETNNGKSKVVRTFIKKHPAEENPEGEAVKFPTVLVQAPKSAKEGDLYDGILRKLKAPFKTSEKDSAKLGLVLNYMRTLQVHMLFIEEFHNILAARSHDLIRGFLYVIKNLSNELEMPIVAIGTKEILVAMQSSEEVANRFVPACIPTWKNDDDFRRLLLSFERKLPLKNPSNLIEMDLATKIISLSEGTIGEIYRLISDAAILAIESKVERITGKLIDQVSDNAPGERKKRAFR